jgi:hypothetical protein
MACHYSQKVFLENRVGLHYSRFSLFLPGTLPENQRLTSRKIIFCAANPRSRVSVRLVGQEFRVGLRVTKRFWQQLVGVSFNGDPLLWSWVRFQARVLVQGRRREGRERRQREQRRPRRAWTPIIRGDGS